MIDWGYEDRLIDRIDARGLLRQIEPRKRRILCASYLRGDTLREIAQVEGISTGRTGQLVHASLAVLRARARVLHPPPGLVARAAPPRRRGASPVPFWFDRVEFLKHMRALIVRREDAERQMFARERAELDRMLEGEAETAKVVASAKAKLPPKPTSPWSKPVGGFPPKPKPKPAFAPWSWEKPAPDWPYPPPGVCLGAPFTFGSGPQRVEPWFDLTKPLTVEHGTQIARYALQYFVAARRPFASGVQHVGAKMERIVCDRTADAIAGALKRFADRLPVVRLSAIPIAEHGAAMACDAVGLRVASGDDDGRSVIITFTWDDA